MIKVKSAEIGDIQDVIAVGHEFWKETPVFNQYPWDLDETIMFLNHIIANEDGCVYIAYKDLDPVGLVIGEVSKFYFSKARFLKDLFIYILPAARGSMAAYLLMKEYLKFGKKKDVEDIFFQVSAGIDNDKSLSFLKKFGFNEISYGLILEKQ